MGKKKLLQKKIIYLLIIFILLTGTTSITSTNTENISTPLYKQQTRTNIEDLNETVENLMIQGHMPSLSACIIKNNSIVWKNNYGYYDIRNEKQPTSDTIYMAGSISKTITATALLQLYEQGKFELDDDINDYLPFPVRNPNYPNDPITIRMLLAHHSSLSHKYLRLFFYFSFLNLSTTWYLEFLSPEGKIYNPNIWQDYPPEEQPCYSSIGFEILGLLIKQLTNQTLEQYCQQHIFKPLNMNNTSFIHTKLNHSQLAVPYIWTAGRYIPIPHYTNKNFASGGLQTTINDLSKFLIAQMNNGTYHNTSILNASTVQLMHTIQYPESQNYSIRQYGLGWIFFIDESRDLYREGHTGGLLGSYCFMFYNKLVDAGVIFFTNQHLRFRIAELLSMFSLLEILFEKSEEL